MRMAGTTGPRMTSPSSLLRRIRGRPQPARQDALLGSSGATPHALSWLSEQLASTFLLQTWRKSNARCCSPRGLPRSRGKSAWWTCWGRLPDARVVELEGQSCSSHREPRTVPRSARNPPDGRIDHLSGTRGEVRGRHSSRSLEHATLATRLFGGERPMTDRFAQNRAHPAALVGEGGLVVVPAAGRRCATTTSPTSSARIVVLLPHRVPRARGCRCHRPGTSKRSSTSSSDRGTEMEVWNGYLRRCRGAIHIRGRCRP